MIKYVTRIYEINVPDDRTKIDGDINMHNYAEDAEIIKASDEAVAVHLSYAYDRGDFTDLVEIYDVTVSDTVPNLKEFELTEGD